MPTKTFEYPITVTEGDIDQLGHVNNIIYLKWVQEIAIAHWNAVATDAMKEQNLWVVSRHEIDYLKSALLTSRLVAKTWVNEEYSGAKSERFVNICDRETEQVYAKVKTTWYLLDRDSKRPKRIEPEMLTIFY
jgi:acyl-CoA thioester hydrolase